MKAYAILRHDGMYVKFTTGYSKLRDITDDVKLARHYKKEGSVKGIIARELNVCEKQIEYYKKREADDLASGQTRQVSWYKKRADEYRTKRVNLGLWKPVEVDVSTPNFSGGKSQEIKFANYDFGVKTKQSQGNMHCKGCGIYFKSIPLLEFGKSRPSRICPWCILEQAEKAKRVIENMKEERREEVEGERFAQQLG